jgi:hypothetical protein
VQLLCRRAAEKVGKALGCQEGARQGTSYTRRVTGKGERPGSRLFSLANRPKRAWRSIGTTRPHGSDFPQNRVSLFGSSRVDGLDLLAGSDFEHRGRGAQWPF